MANIFGRLFDLRTGDEKKRDFENYSKKIFPFGDEQKEKVFSILLELFPKEKQKYLRMHYILIKEGMTNENPLDYHEATKSIAKKTLIRTNKELNTLLETLITIDLGIDETLNYPSTDEIKEQAKQYMFRD